MTLNPTAYPSTRRQDLVYCALLLLILLAFYLLLQNGRWFSGPDTAFYISIARNIALGRGFVFNGGAVARTPPGWPLALAGAMKISPSFLFINLLPMACVLAAAGIWYFCLRRLVAPARAFAIMLLSGMLFWWYCSTVQLRSEALFSLCFAAALLLAWQVAEGRAQSWRIALLVLACAAMVLVRYAGLLGWAVVGAVVVSGQLRPALNRQWISLALTLAVTVALFFSTRHILTKVLPPQVVAPPPTTAPAAAADAAPRGPLDAWSPEMSEEPRVLGLMPGKGLADYAQQVLSAGQWLTGLLWMPSHVAVSSKALGALVGLFGWFLLLVLAVYLLTQACQRQWALIGVAIYSGLIILRWRGSNPRYLMPVAPLLLLGLWMGFEHLANTLRRPALARLFRLGVPLLLSSVGLCNLGLYAVDAFIARSPDFYHRYYAGEVEDLVGAAKYLHTQNVADGQIAVNAQYINLNRTRPNGFGMRGLVMLMDKGIRVIPNSTSFGQNKKLAPERLKANKRKANRVLIDGIGSGEPNANLIKYALKNGIRYYVYRPPISPWRAWHFRVGFLQQRLTGKPVQENPGWILYDLKDAKATEINLPTATDWPTRVPGMEEKDK